MKGNKSQQGKKWDDFLTKEQQSKILAKLKAAPKKGCKQAGWNRRPVNNDRQ
jgi:hypothetical protein